MKFRYEWIIASIASISLCVGTRYVFDWGTKFCSVTKEDAIEEEEKKSSWFRLFFLALPRKQACDSRVFLRLETGCPC